MSSAPVPVAGIMRSVADDDLWYAMPLLSGRLIRLEPLTVEHAPGYLAAAGTKAEAAEVFRWLSPPGGRWPSRS
ncbi:MAG TPA: hypothetical protein VN597_17225, partial [Streptosporangiaceae bacterium]|nr:hypothetical protein [Streptosporangiaceae bacterium]